MGRGAIRSAANFNWATKVIIGLMNMGYLTDREMAPALGEMEPEDYNTLGSVIHALKTSDNPLVRKCVDIGLPPRVTAELPFPCTIRCKACGASVNMVPCVLCRNKMLTSDEFERDDIDNWRPVPAAISTHHRPGTYEKIEVMRQRVARGEAPFHPDDAARVDFSKLQIPFSAIEASTRLCHN